MANFDGEQLEYALDDSVSLAIVDGVGAGRARGTTQTEIVERSYFDTARRDLATRGFELRCQPSDPVAGWQLRRSDGPSVPLLAVALNADASTPREILDRTLGLRGGREIVEFAHVRGEHTSHEIVDSHGRLVCALTDSVFTATVAAESSLSAQQWRTVSLRPTNEADPELLARLDRRLRKAGRRLAAPHPDLATVLSEGGGVLAARRDLVGDYVHAQRAAMLLSDVRLRPSDPGRSSGGRSLGESEEADIHDARVAVRRLRSTLRTFANAFDGQLSREPSRQSSRALLRELDAELAWYAAALGRVRDQQVLLDRLLTALAEVPAELILGPVAATISEHLLTQTQQHRHDLHEVLRSPRYLALLESVDALVLGLAESTPLRPREIRRNLAKADGRLSRRLTEARAQAGTPTADIASHTARKAAKRARYAAELASPVLNRDDAAATIKRLQRLQDSLGTHQDGVVAVELLRRLGAAASQSGQNGFTFGLLCEREMAALRAGRARLGG